MKRLLVSLLALLMLSGSSVAAVAAQDDDATPDVGELSEGSSDGTNPVDPVVGDAITYFDENGDAVGVATVQDVERGWEEYGEYDAPERGFEYVAFVITVESTIERGAIDVESYDFSLQTSMGGFWGTAYASSDTAEPPLLEDTVSLANGDSEEFTVVYLVHEDDTLAHLFWQPDSGVLLTLAQLEDI